MRQLLKRDASVPSSPHPHSQLRHDQLAMLRSLFLLAFLVFTWAMFHNDWPRWLLWALQALMVACVASGAFFLGRFQTGQRWVLFGLQPLPTRRTDVAEGTDFPRVQAYASLDEAKTTGWTFFELVGRYGVWPIPRWAHDGDAWFEFQGLDTHFGSGLRQDERVFGLFVYRLVPPDQNPDHPEPWSPPQPSA